MILCVCGGGPIFLSGLLKKTFLTSAPISTQFFYLDSLKDIFDVSTNINLNIQISIYISMGRHNDWTLIVKEVSAALVGLVIVILINQGSILHIGRSWE